MGDRIFDDEDEITDEAVRLDAGARIVKSLEQYIYQTSKHLCVNTGLSIGTVIDYIDGNGDEIYGEQVGNIWVYYLPENHPARRTPPIKLYFGGPDGRMICFREEAPRGNTGNLKVGDTFVFERQSSSFDESTRRGPGRPRTESSDIDLEELEELATINPNQKSIADALDVGHSQLVVWIRNRKEVRQAYERGAAKHKKPAAKPEEKPKEKTKMEQPTKSNESKKTGYNPPSPSQSSANADSKPLTLRERVTPSILERASAGGISLNELAVQLGITSKNPYTQLYNLITNPKYPELKAAWEAGKFSFEKTKAQQRIAERHSESEKPVAPVANNSAATDFIIPEKPVEEAKPPIELPPIQKPVADEIAPSAEVETEDENSEPVDQTNEPNDELSSPQPIASLERREKIEEVQEKLMPKARSYGGEVEFLGRILSRRPAGLQIGFEGDFFSLSEKQRRLMCEMAALNDEFQQED